MLIIIVIIGWYFSTKLILVLYWLNYYRLVLYRKGQMENVRLIQFNRYRLSLIFIIVTLPLSLVFSLSAVLASAPIVQDDNYATNEDTPLIVAAPGVLANDTGSGSGVLTAVKDSDPVGGTLVLSSAGAFTYTPALDFNGVVTFTYHANDDGGDSTTAVVTITVTAVNDAPVAVNDNYATTEDTVRWTV